MNNTSPPDITSGQAGLPLVSLDSQMTRALLDSIPARVIVTDRAHRFVFVNREMLDFIGARLEQIVGRHVRDVIGDAYESSYAPLSERLYQRKETVRSEGWVEYPHAGRRYVQEQFLPYAPDGGEAQAVFVFVRDLTELKLREAELADKVRELETAESLKGAIVDHALAALIVSDDTGHVVEFNPAAETLFGHTRSEALGRTVSELIVPERHRAAHAEGMARALQGGETRVMGRRVELPALRADGSEVPVEMLLWRTEVAGRAHFTASLFDLTERHKANQEIERQRDALRQSEKLTAMGSLLAGVAHELNNPLAIVMGRATLLEEKCQGQPGLQQDAHTVREAAERCGRIVRTFLNMARSAPAQRSALSLNDLIKAATEMLGYTLRSHGIELVFHLSRGLPDVWADRDQIGQVLMNLFVNAQQALSSRDGPRVVTVTTGLESRRANRHPRVWMRVSDNGGGVEAGLEERIFEPFFTTKPVGVGTGLGLAVSRSMVREHGGNLVLERGEGGATFRLSLPTSDVEAQASAVPASLQPSAPESTSARLLVVDDEEEIADLIRAMLEGAGHEVVTAESGAVALEILEHARFDGIVSDLRMPDIDGAALWRLVSARYPHLARRTLFVTGDTLSPGARQFLNEAQCPSLDKPFTREDLVGRVSAMLKS